MGNIHTYEKINNTNQNISNLNNLYLQHMSNSDDFTIFIDNNIKNTHRQFINDLSIYENKNKFNNAFYNITNDTNIDINVKHIHNQFINNLIAYENKNKVDRNIFCDMINGISVDVDKLFIVGLYYQYKQIDYNKMKKCYLKLINMNYILPIYHLIKYYKYIEKNYDEMKKYLLMLTEINCCYSMYELGIHYLTIDKDFDSAKKYISMSIKNGFDYNKLKDDLDDIIIFYILQDIELFIYNNNINICISKNKSQLFLQNNIFKNYAFFTNAIQNSSNNINNFILYYELLKQKYNRKTHVQFFISLSQILQIKYGIDYSFTHIIDEIDEINKINKICKIDINEIHYENNNECCVCFENIEPKLNFSCVHSVCHLCYDKLDKCPICRKNK